MGALNEKGRVWEILKSLLSRGEVVGYHVAERRSGGADLLEPAHAFATDRRIIIIREGIFGVHQDFKIINYVNITEIILHRGFFFSSIHFSLQGEVADAEEKKWLVGLKYGEALGLVHFVNNEVERPIATRGVRSTED